MTAGFPSVTAHKVKIGTVAGKAPAVVKRPDDLFPAAAKIVKKQPDVDVVAVKVVKPDHIRVILPHSP